MCSSDLFDHFEDRRKPVEPAIAMGWIVRGFLHAALFTLLLQLLLFVQGRFSAGLSSFHWWEIVLLGPFLFLISYLEKSRVTYLVAGHLSLVGYRLEPDFRSPWLARDLLEYWRRFHYWMWEYYVDFVYLPLSTYLARTFGPREASLLALFLTFTVGTSIVHWVHYPAPFVTALVLGLLFGLASLFHGIFSKALQRSRWGTAFTWLTVFFLYILAYPAYGLGWGVHDFFEFLRR